MKDTAEERPPIAETLMAPLRKFFNQPMDSLSSLRAKLVLPYMLLTLMLAFVGIFVITRLVAASVTERFFNQLLEAGRVSADAMVRHERDQLRTLRLMTFTVGVPSAIQRDDTDAVTNFVLPIGLNAGLESVVVLDSEGRELVGLQRTSVEEPYVRTSGASFSGFPFVHSVLQGGSDDQGDKFVGLVETAFGTYLYTAAPVQNADGEVLGAILAGTTAPTLANELKAQALADVLLIDQQGELVASTFPQEESDPGNNALLPSDSEGDSGVDIREFEMFGRPYQAADGAWVVRGEELGTMTVVLPSNFVVSAEATSRNLFSLIFTLGVVAVIAVGYILSQNIAGPILRLRTMAQAVAGGDLSQVSGFRRTDEIGDLAEAFDVMTARLYSRTEEAKRLYQETVERNQQLAEMYERLQAAQQQVIQSEKLAAVGQLAAGIVHDVKNPLGVIKGMAEELMLDADGQPEVEQGLKIIRDNATRANLIVTDLLKFARQSTPSMQQRDLRTTIEGCLRLTDYLIRKGRVVAELELPESAIWVTYDAQQFEQVLINLIQNAVQAMPDGGRLRIVVEDAENDVRISVSDTGEGIPEANQSRIFEPFFTTKPEGQGTGMGLAVSYGIVSRHGGRLDVQSEMGEGSTFTISLPKQIKLEPESASVPT